MSSVTINYHLSKDVLEVTGSADDVITVAKALMYTNGKANAKLTVNGTLPQIKGNYGGLAKRDKPAHILATPEQAKIPKGKLVPTGTYVGLVEQAWTGLSKGREMEFTNDYGVPFTKFASGIRSAIADRFGAGSYNSRTTEEGKLAVKLLK